MPWLGWMQSMRKFEQVAPVANTENTKTETQNIQRSQKHIYQTILNTHTHTQILKKLSKVNLLGAPEQLLIQGIFQDTPQGDLFDNFGHLRATLDRPWDGTGSHFGRN